MGQCLSQPRPAQGDAGESAAQGADDLGHGPGARTEPQPNASSMVKAVQNGCEQVLVQPASPGTVGGTKAAVVSSTWQQAQLSSRLSSTKANVGRARRGENLNDFARRPTVGLTKPSFAGSQPCSLTVLSTCVRTRPASSTEPERDEDGAEVINGLGCCGPITKQLSVDLDNLTFGEEALRIGREGGIHDVVRYGAPRPANEDRRMATVRALRGMDVGSCPEVDLILKVICRIWEAPSACVTLLDSEHVFICSAEGFAPSHRPWSVAMCPWMLLSPHPTAMAVGDLTADARFSKSAHVKGGTRAYLTSPLVASNGHRLGAICITDTKPRRFDAGDCRLMNNCAELAIRALEAHLSVSKRIGARSRTHHSLRLPLTSSGNDPHSLATAVGPSSTLQGTTHSCLSNGSGPSGAHQSTHSYLSGGGLTTAGRARNSMERESGSGLAAAGRVGSSVGVGASSSGRRLLLPVSRGGGVAGEGGVEAGVERERERESGTGARSLERPTDLELVEEYKHTVRDLAELDDAVVLLVDTGPPGWRLLYASASWEPAVGVPRAEVVGATLNEVMAHVNGDSRVVWEGVEREAAAGKPFVTPRVYCRSAPAVTFYLSFRPAALGDIDESTVTIGVPASVPQAASSTTSKLFFARLHTTPDPPVDSRAQTHLSPILTTGRRLPASTAINPVHGLTDLYQGMVVGQVLGQGSYGTVYHGKWHGVDVAIKVQDMHIRSAEERERAEFEVSLGQRLHHINIVRTLTHASALLERPAGLSPPASGSNAWASGCHVVPMGMMVANASQADGPGEGEGTEGGVVPSFMPFFGVLNNDDGGAAALAAYAASAAAASAAAAAAAAAAAGNMSTANSSVTGFAKREIVSETQEKMLRFAVANASVGGGRNVQPLPIVPTDGPTTGALVRVALPSGAQVPLLRQPNADQRSPPTATAALTNSIPSEAVLRSLLALAAARDSVSSPRSRSLTATGHATGHPTNKTTPTPTNTNSNNPSAHGGGAFHVSRTSPLCPASSSSPAHKDAGGGGGGGSGSGGGGPGLPAAVPVRRAPVVPASSNLGTHRQRDGAVSGSSSPSPLLYGSGSGAASAALPSALASASTVTQGPGGSGSTSPSPSPGGPSPWPSAPASAAAADGSRSISRSPSPSPSPSPGGLSRSPSPSPLAPGWPSAVAAANGGSGGTAVLRRPLSGLLLNTMSEETGDDLEAAERKALVEGVADPQDVTVGIGSGACAGEGRHVGASGDAAAAAAAASGAEEEADCASEASPFMAMLLPTSSGHAGHVSTVSVGHVAVGTGSSEDTTSMGPPAAAAAFDRSSRGAGGGFGSVAQAESLCVGNSLSLSLRGVAAKHASGSAAAVQDESAPQCASNAHEGDDALSFAINVVSGAACGGRIVGPGQAAVEVPPDHVASLGEDMTFPAAAPPHQPQWHVIGSAPPGALASALAAAGGGDGGGEGEVTAAAAASTTGGAAVPGPIDVDLAGLSYPVDVRLWMVLEFMDRGSLQDAIDRGWLREGRTANHGPDYPAVLATAAEVAAGVAYLHANDVVHGDLSAVNVLLQSVKTDTPDTEDPSTPVGPAARRARGAGDTTGRGFVAKVSDFGLSMQLTTPDQVTKAAAYGTITHMAPEVLRNSTLSKPADVYSIGVLLWQMVTGSRPWAGLSHLQVSIEVGDKRRQLQWPPWSHAGVRALGQRCMSARPKDRPTAQQLLQELTALMQAVPQYA